MFNLKDASIAMRKAAAINGIKSGMWEPFFDSRDNGNPESILAKVYNKNYPDGIEITEGECYCALFYTWEEIER